MEIYFPFVLVRVSQPPALPINVHSVSLTSSRQSRARRPSHHFAFSATQLTTFCSIRILSISCTSLLMLCCTTQRQSEFSQMKMMTSFTRIYLKGIRQSSYKCTFLGHRTDLVSFRGRNGKLS